MESLERRRLLQFSLALTSLALGGCGSSAGVAPETSGPAPAPPVSPPPPPPGSPPPPPPPPAAPSPSVGSSGAMAFTLASPTAATAPFCLGFAFRPGDVPSGQGVVGDVAHLQVTPLNRWPDGSLKFALVAGRAALAANTPATITLSTGTAAAGTALALSDLQATGVTAAVGCGSFGSVNWASADWAAPFSTFATGPEMSSWLYRKPVGTDRSLVAWLEVRLYADGSVEVLPWIENGYLKVAGATSRSATYTFTLGGSQRFSGAIDLPARARTPLLDGTRLSHWLGADPAVAARHDVAYLQSTELVPSYRATVDDASALVTGLVSTYAPLQQGNFDYNEDVMGSSGYASPIGLLPQHDMLYLVAQSMAIGATIQRNGYSAGRYAIHYRDEATNRPLRFSQHATTSTNYSSSNDVPVVATGTVAPQWDVAHSPSVGYMAYLLSGRAYFMEQVQFAATANYLFSTDGVRNGADGWFEPVPGGVQERQCAWAFRTLIQALSATPDADVLQAEFKASVEANIARYHGRYVAQPNNPLGFVQPSLDYSTQYGPTSAAAATAYMCAGWQQDFITAAWGWAVAMRLPVAASAQSDLAAFFQWKAISIVGRLGASATGGSYWYINAAPYNIAISANHAPDFAGGTGPWLASWSECYARTKAVADTGQLAAFGTTEGQLSAEALPGANSMWGNLQPAIAYAVRHGVPGAAAAYQRMTSAANWPALATQLDAVPVWSVQPLA